MTAVVHKHHIDETVTNITLTAGATVIHAGPDPSGKLCIWETHPAGSTRAEHRRFRLVGTGHPIEERIVQHIGSYVTGPLVLHLFEVEP